MSKVKVLIVDDSILIRRMFREILSADPDIEVLDTATDPLDAREKIKALNPDVITLDIEMPKMDGISFLEKIMSLRPMPVVMVSSLTQKGAEATLQALEIGAVDFLPKTSSTSFDTEMMSVQLVEKVKAAAKAKIIRQPITAPRESVSENSAAYHPKSLIAVGSSTGGVEALRSIIPRLPKSLPPIVITQHMPPLFTATFAKRLDDLCALHVVEAGDGVRLAAGGVYVAPGDRHLRVSWVGGGYAAQLTDDAQVSGHKPSVDVLFSSVASSAGEYALGVILTGMGKDGTQGLLEMRRAGARTLGQDEESCVVYGMPKAAWMANAVERQVSLDAMPRQIMAELEGMVV